MVTRPRCSSCGHVFTEHWNEAFLVATGEEVAGRCHARKMLDGSECPCRDYVDAILPEPGERLTFGVHRLGAADRDFSLPSEADRDAAFKKWAQGAIKDLTS